MTTLYFILFSCLAVVYSLNPDEDCEILAGTGIPGTSDGLNEVATFYYVRGSLWWNNALYVADDKCVRVVSSVYTRTFTGVCATDGDVDGDYSTARFNDIHAIASYGEYLYVLDSGNNKIKQVDTVGYSTTVMILDTYVTSVATSMTISGDLMILTSVYQVLSCSMLYWNCSSVAGVEGTRGYKDGYNTAALFKYIFGVAYIWNKIIVSDFGSYCVRQIEGGLTSTLYGTCEGRGEESGVTDDLY